jgi:serine/threonine-protein kinase
MATVYLAHDLTLDRRAALKVMSPELRGTAELVEHFLNEARVMARLRGPHVARVFDCGRIQHSSAADLPFMVLELLDGVDLLTALQQSGAFEEALAARYMLETCEGLAEAHALAIVHRDIKPENLFLARQVDGTYGVKLLDFGISKSIDDRRIKSLTTAKDLVGSPLYMSPEQMMAQPLDPRTDIWSLGAVMYECVAGEPAFGAATVCEICARVLTDPIPSLRQRNVGVSEAYINVVERCLQRDPNERFQNVAELAAALEPIARLQGYSHAQSAAAALGVPPPGANIIAEETLLRAEHEASESVAPSLSSNGSRSHRWPIALSAALIMIGGLLTYGWHQYPNETTAFMMSLRGSLVAWLYDAGRHL